MKFPAWLNVLGRACSAVGIFLLVKSPAHGWRVLALQASVGAIVTAVVAAKMYGREPSISGGRHWNNR